jgi:hypothetical protein
LKITVCTEGKPCKKCGKPVESTGNKALYCNQCKATDKTLHYGIRDRSLEEIIVHVDTEGDGKGNIVSASYGREDGTSGSIITGSAPEIIMWWIENLSGTHHGKRQIVGAFHFNYDTAVLAKFMDRSSSLRIIHKAKSTGGIICNSVKCKCSKIHAFDREAATRIITTGGEGDAITWDARSCIAIAATPKRRFYAEYRPHGWSFREYKALDIHDMGTAFVGGLERVIDTWLPELAPEQRDIIAWGKQARKQGFRDTDTTKAALYSEAECVAAARCARLLISTISDAAEVKMKANALFGSGSLATAAFRKHRLADRLHTEENSKIDVIAQMTYFGGLIETPVIGIIDGSIHEEDLNSAYPAAMVTLPCMKSGHGKWKTAEKGISIHKFGLDDNTVGHVKVDWRVTAFSTPPFMVRDKYGSVYQPLQGHDVWVTMAEYVNACKNFKGSKSDFIVAKKASWHRGVRL